MSILQCRLVLPLRESRDIRDLSRGERARSFPACGPLAVLLVGGDVEGDEEDEVGCDGDDAGEGGELFPCAVAGVGHPGPVG